MRPHIPALAALALLPLLAACDEEARYTGSVYDLDAVASVYAPAEASDTVYHTVGDFDPSGLSTTTVTRRYAPDSLSRSMTVTLRAATLRDYPSLTNMVAARVDTAYARASGRALMLGRVGTAQTLEEAFDRVGRDFADSLVPTLRAEGMSDFRLSADFRPVNRRPADDVVTYATYIDWYAGGAREVRKFYYTTLDPATATVLTLDDLASPAEAEAIRNALIDLVASQYGISEDELFERIDRMQHRQMPLPRDSFPTGRVAVIPEGWLFQYRDGELPGLTEGGIEAYLLAKEEKI